MRRWRFWSAGAAKRLLISGANKTATKDELKTLSNGGRRFDCCADIGYAAEDTYGNAEEAAEWTAQHHFRSLIVVTAAYPHAAQPAPVPQPDAGRDADRLSRSSRRMWDLSQWWHTRARCICCTTNS